MIIGNKKFFLKGDRVAYSRPFLQSIKGHHLGNWKGTVSSVSQLNNGPLCVRVEWDNGHSTPVLSKNLVLLQMMPLETY